MVLLHYKRTFYFVLQHRRMVDTKLILSRLQETVVIKYQRHAAYERINSKTETWKNIKNSSRQHCTYHGILLVSLLMLHREEFFKAKFVYINSALLAHLPGVFLAQSAHRLLFGW